jgi:TP53 regulating kinase-like protein
LEYVEGRTVRAVLDEWAEGVKGEGEGHDGEILDLMRRVGSEVGKLHNLGVCHGDLTTSNLMLRTPAPAAPVGRQTTSAQREAAMSGIEPPSVEPQQPLAGTIYLIDFGLTSATIQDEDRAVDLYVLERAFAATHPAAEPLFQEVLSAYAESYKGAKPVLKKLEGVRMRGRKRSMLG